MSETPKQAARKLAASAIREGFVPQALHEYTDQDGKPLYWRIRLKKPDTGEKWIRPMKRSGDAFVLGEPEFPEGKPLYRLNDLAARPDEAVVLTEGEWCADALAKAGVLATTSGAADSAAKADWKPLVGRSVTIWPDNDRSGRRYAEAVKSALESLGCAVRLIDVEALNLLPKGDAADWVVVTPNATAADILALPTVAAASRNEAAETTLSQSDEHECLIDAVAKLAALHSLEYERVREAEAQRLGVRVGVLDKEVSIARRARQEDGGKAAMFPTVEPWPETVEGAALLNELLFAIQRFIVCEKETAIAASLWCAFTWLVDWVEVAPLAVITAPEKRCGKSQLLNLIGRLSRKPLVASNISPAATFRVIEAQGPTLLIDEADTFFRENEELRGVINSGHTRQSAYVIRTVGDDHEPRQFSTWGAKAISGIGHLAETIMDRAVILELRRKLPSETVQRLRHAEPGLFDRLASRLARYADDAGPAIERARPELPEALNDRAQDNWEPLLAIADHAGGEWPELARHAALKLSGVEQEPVSLSAELLDDIREVFEEKKVSRMFVADMMESLVSDDLKSWATYNRGKPMSPKQLAKRLGEYGISSKQIRIGYESKKGFELEQLQDAFSRYLTPPNRTPFSTETTKQNAGTQGTMRVSRVSGNVGCFETEKRNETLEPAPILDCFDVSGKTGVSSGGMVEVEL